MQPVVRSSLAKRKICHQTCVYGDLRTAARRQYAVSSKALSSTFAPRSNHPLQSCSGAGISKRRFSQGLAHARPEQITAQTNKVEPIPEYSFSIRQEQKAVSHSQIRKSLRAWSSQHEKFKHENIPDDIPSEGRVTHLPSALFIGENHSSDRSQEEQRTEENMPENNLLVGDSLKPGTLMTHKTAGAPQQNVIYLGDIGVQSLLLLSDGRWSAEKIAQKRHGISSLRDATIANFISTDDIASLRAHMPKKDLTRTLEEDGAVSTIRMTGPIPENVTKSILQKMKKFADEEKNFIRDNKAQLDQMYDVLAFQTEWRRINIKDLPSLVLGVEYYSMSDSAKKAFVNFANNFDPFFIHLQTASTLTYTIAPKCLKADLRLVQEWTRHYQEAAAQAAIGKDVSNRLKENPLSSFIDKARRIILRSRKIRSPTNFGALGPAVESGVDGLLEKVPSGEVFTQNDKRIIAYLWDTSMRRPVSKIGTSHSSLIVRAIGAYPDAELDFRVFKILLQELGCVDPWSNMQDFSVRLPGTKSSESLDRLLKEARDSILPQIATDQTRATMLADSMSHLRHDWGSMEAFCIDRSGTNNFEDAFSMEPAAEVDGGYWLHTHVAHPTAHLGVNHPVTQFARKRGVAFYSIDDITPPQTMLPTNVIRQFSLKSGAPVLTISTLLSNTGCVIEVRVVPAYITNVVFLDRTAVEEVMGVEKPKEATLVVGKIPDTQLNNSAREPDVEKAMKYKPKLSSIKELLLARTRSRQAETQTTINFPAPSFGIKVSATVPERYRAGREFESYHWKGDGGILLSGKREVSTSETAIDSDIHDLVGQTMRLTAESLGKWLADRHIPAIFTGNEPLSESTIEQLREGTMPNKTASLTFTRTTFPRPLLRRQIQQYAGCTSPLRRFIDMINHFQVDAYLKAQAEGLIHSDTLVTSKPIVAFTRTELEDYLAEDAASGDAFYGWVEEMQSQWAIQALFRAFYFQEANLPDTLEALITEPARRNASGQLENAKAKLVPWGLEVSLEPTLEGFEKMAQYNTFVPIKIKSILPGGIGLITAEAVGPSTDKQSNLESIELYTAKNLLPAEKLVRKHHVYDQNEF